MKMAEKLNKNKKNNSSVGNFSSLFFDLGETSSRDEV